MHPEIVFPSDWTTQRCIEWLADNGRYQAQRGNIQTIHDFESYKNGHSRASIFVGPLWSAKVTWEHENAADPTTIRITKLETMLQRFIEPLHDGPCEYTDKADEGCCLCNHKDIQRHTEAKELLGM